MDSSIDIRSHTIEAGVGEGLAVLICESQGACYVDDHLSQLRPHHRLRWPALTRLCGGCARGRGRLDL